MTESLTISDANDYEWTILADSERDTFTIRDHVGKPNPSFTKEQAQELAARLLKWAESGTIMLLSDIKNVEAARSAGFLP